MAKLGFLVHLLYTILPSKIEYRQSPNWRGFEYEYIQRGYRTTAQEAPQEPSKTSEHYCTRDVIKHGLGFGTHKPFVSELLIRKTHVIYLGVPLPCRGSINEQHSDE